MPAGPEAKESPCFFDLVAFSSEVLIIFCTVVQCWQSNAKARLRQVRSVTNSKANVKEHVPVQKVVLTQNYDAKILPAASYLDAGRRIKDSGRPVDIYIYLYIYRDRKPSQHVTVGLAWGSPQSQKKKTAESNRKLISLLPQQAHVHCDDNAKPTTRVSASARCSLPWNPWWLVHAGAHATATNE